MNALAIVAESLAPISTHAPGAKPWYKSLTLQGAALAVTAPEFVDTVGSIIDFLAPALAAQIGVDPDAVSATAKHLLQAIGGAALIYGTLRRRGIRGPLSEEVAQ